MKAPVMVKPATISYDKYEIFFIVPHYFAQPMPLDDNDKYLYMVEHALKAHL